METPGQKFCLRWDSFQSSVTSMFDLLRQDGQLVDITLCCEGQRMRAHRMMLSACSPYFRDIIQENPCENMVIFLKDTSAADLRGIIEFMYKGSVNVNQSQLPSFIKTAEMLQIRGLSGDEDKTQAVDSPARGSAETAPWPPPDTPPPRKRRRSGSDGAFSRPPSVPLSAPQPKPQLEPQPQPQPQLEPDPEPEPGPEPEPEWQPEPEPEPEVPVKVEKVEVDLTEEDESLDMALGSVADFAEYEEQDGATRPEPIPHVFPVHTPSPGGAGGQSSPAQTGSHVCEQCGKSYKSVVTLTAHRKLHEGRTRCQICGRVYGKVSTLREHLMFVHRLSKEEMRGIVPTRPCHRAVPGRPFSELLLPAGALGASDAWPASDSAARETGTSGAKGPKEPISG